MDDAQAELHAIEPLEALAQAIVGLSGCVGGQLDETEAEFMPRFRRLQRAEKVADDAVRAARQAVANADGPDDRRAAENWLEEAEDAKRRLDDAMSDVRRALGAYKAAAGELARARRGAFSEAIGYLHEKIAAARAYLAITLQPGQAAPDADRRASSTAIEPDPEELERVRALDSAVEDMIRRSEDRTKRPDRHSDYWVAKGDLLTDFDVLKRLCGGPITENSNGSLSVTSKGTTYTLYHSGEGPLGIHIHDSQSELKFRYFRF